jgi:hypothetical protein
LKKVSEVELKWVLLCLGNIWILSDYTKH